MKPNSPILFFDGVCNLCNKWVDFIIRIDQSEQFKFASLQSTYAQKTLATYQLDPKDLDTVILLYQGKIFQKSKAAAKAIILLGGWRSIFGRLLLFIPAPLADFGYDIVARNRYKLYGKRASCRLPSAAERERFID